jgi:hypothetical protein
MGLIAISQNDDVLTRSLAKALAIRVVAAGQEKKQLLVKATRPF